MISCDIVVSFLNMIFVFHIVKEGLMKQLPTFDIDALVYISHLVILSIFSYTFRNSLSSSTPSSSSTLPVSYSSRCSTLPIPRGEEQETESLLMPLMDTTIGVGSSLPLFSFPSLGSTISSSCSSTHFPSFRHKLKSSGYTLT